MKYLVQAFDRSDLRWHTTFEAESLAVAQERFDKIVEDTPPRGGDACCRLLILLAEA